VCVVIAVVLGSQTLHGEQRFVSRVEVKAQRPRDPGYMASVLTQFLPFNLAPGKAARWREVPISIDSWTTDAFGEAGRTAAAAGASITTLVTAGLADPAPRGLSLRQVIVSPIGGFRVEARVTSAIAEPVPADVFVVPTGYRLVPDPRRRPALPNIR
jgi:hypothetical protein